MVTGLEIWSATTWCGNCVFNIFLRMRCARWGCVMYYLLIYWLTLNLLICLVGDMPKGHGCDRKRQAKENWIRAVALLRL